MRLSVSCRKPCPKRSQGASRGAFAKPASGVFLVLMLLLVSVQGAYAAGSGRLFTPPPVPDVAPVISGMYPEDLDGNRIADELDSADLPSGPSTLFDASRSLSPLAGAESVDVELIFDEPVTQDQIDTFLQLGGEITYMYQAVSFGWNGRIDRDCVSLLPSAMGPTLALVTPRTLQIQLHMDLATQDARVRPVWQPGFAGSVDGFRGDPNTTIAIVDTGVDNTHPDFAERFVYWSDISGDYEPNPVDYYGHGSLVAGVAAGTGETGGAEPFDLHYTYSLDSGSWLHVTEPISLPAGPVTVTSSATWDGPSAWLDHIYWRKGTVLGTPEWIGVGAEGTSGLTITHTFDADEGQVFSPILADYDDGYLYNVTIVSQVSKYPAVGDGFNTFSGVAPGCMLAGVKFATRDGYSYADAVQTALDDLVVRRTDKNIKIINISAGLVDSWGLPGQSMSMRDKVTSTVRSGVILVVSAGNEADVSYEEGRAMGDPARAAMAITVGASNDNNALTDYSTYGFTEPRDFTGEGFKPDLIAPGGSYYYTSIMSVDSGSTDGGLGPDREPNDYTAAQGTSFSSPFVSGCAALVIEAMERQGIRWDFNSDRHPRQVKMLLCATASETNARRENGRFNPTLDRASGGAGGFPAGKDRYEGYGMVNADAAVEAISLTYELGTSVSETFGSGTADRRVWARTVQLSAGTGIDVTLDNPSDGDFDLYLYRAKPSASGTPVLLASSANPGFGVAESLSYTPESDTAVLLVVKRVLGAGTFELHSEQIEESNDTEQ